MQGEETEDEGRERERGGRERTNITKSKYLEESG